jgi:hypothetical protein
MEEYRVFIDPTEFGAKKPDRRELIKSLKKQNLKPDIEIKKDRSFINKYNNPDRAKIIKIKDNNPDKKKIINTKISSVYLIYYKFKKDKPWFAEDVYESLKDSIESLNLERCNVSMYLNMDEKDYGKLEGKLKNNIMYFNKNSYNNTDSIVKHGSDIICLKKFLIDLDDADAADDIEVLYGNRLSRVIVIVDKIEKPEFLILDHGYKTRIKKSKITNWGNHDISIQYLARNPVTFMIDLIYTNIVKKIYVSLTLFGNGKISVIANLTNIVLYGPHNMIYIESGGTGLVNSDYANRTIAVLKKTRRNEELRKDEEKDEENDEENKKIKEIKNNFTENEFIEFNKEELEKLKKYITQYDVYLKKDHADVSSLKLILREWIVPSGSGKTGHELALYYVNSIVDPFIEKGNLCGHACLAMALTYINNPDNVKNLKNSKRSDLTNLALKYANILNISTPLTYSDFDIFVEKCKNGEFGLIDGLINPNIVVTIMTSMDDEQPYRTMFKNKENINYVTHWIYILHFKEHYQYIVNIENFVKTSKTRTKWCHWCCKLYEKKLMRNHACCLKCGNCKHIFQSLDEREIHIVKCDERCSICKFRYKYIGCKTHHKCGYHQCLKCDTIYDPKKMHYCDKKYCLHCDVYYPELDKHRCYIKKVKVKKNYNSIWCYDIEAYSNMVSKGVYHNEAALIVTIELDTNFCLIFNSLKLFIKWVNTGEIGTSNRIKLQTFEIVRIFDDWNDIEYSPKLRDTVNLKPKLMIAHNGAAYDTYIILKEIKSETVQEIKNVILDGQKIISLTFSGCKFIDSRKHMSMRLDSMAKTFSLSSSKGYFPYRFFNTTNKNYIGPIPDLEYFNKDSSSSSDKEFMKWYNSYSNKDYNIWEECIKYCVQDTSLLVECMEKYRDFGIELTGLNPLNYLTISSYSQNIYRHNHYLKEGVNENNPIAILTRSEYDFCRNAFFGGRTDARVLHVKSLKGMLGIFSLDVNGLYPTVMTYDLLPYGDPWNGVPCKGISNCHLFIKNLHLDGNCAIIKCNITCPKNLYHPVLPEKLDGKLTFHLNITSGTWPSCELEMAISKGYTINSIVGSLCFKTCNNLFTTYMDKFISLKEKHSKDSIHRNDGLNSIGKMCSSGLWGKFGQRDHNKFTKFFNANKIDDWHRLIGQFNNDKIADINVHELNNNYIYATITTNLEENLNLKTTNIALAAFITSRARLRLFALLDKYGPRAAYCDTDSIYIMFSSLEEQEEILNGNDIGPKLGQWKNECIVKIDGVDYLDPIIEFIGLGPKTYAKKSMLGNECVKSKGFNDKSFTFAMYKDLAKTYIKNNFKNTTKLTSTQLHFRRGSGIAKDSIYTYDNYVKNLVVSLLKFYIKSPLITLPFGHMDIPI